MTQTHTETRSPQPRGVDLPPAATYAIDPSHTTVSVIARHLVVSKVRGQFGDVRGTVTVADEWDRSHAEVVVGAASINTNNADRDAHLVGPDFLDAERYPELTFRSATIEHKSGDRFALAGDLTIKGVTRPITFDLEFLGTIADPWGNDRIAFAARGELDREAWDITWNVALETGGVLVSKKLQFELEVQAVRQRQPGPEADQG